MKINIRPVLSFSFALLLAVPSVAQRGAGGGGGNRNNGSVRSTSNSSVNQPSATRNTASNRNTTNNANANRNTNVNQNANVNRNTNVNQNTNINVNRNVNVDGGGYNNSQEDVLVSGDDLHFHFVGKLFWPYSRGWHDWMGAADSAGFRCGATTFEARTPI